MLVTEVNLGSKCRKERREREREREGEREREQLIIEAIYLDLEDIKQSKSDGGKETDRQRQSPTPFIKSLLGATS